MSLQVRIRPAKIEDPAADTKNEPVQRVSKIPYLSGLINKPRDQSLKSAKQATAQL